jgi:Domain of unknown function (DUF4326)
LNKYKAGVPHGAVYCGRGSPYGNPFVIGRDGDRDQVCERFERGVEAYRGSRFRDRWQYGLLSPQGIMKAAGAFGGLPRELRTRHNMPPI